MTHSPNRSTRLRAARRSAFVRLFALLVAVLALGAQQRVVKTVRLPAASATRVAVERSVAVETNAVRAAPLLRVAPAPILARLPVATVALASSRFPNARLLVTHAAFLQRAQLVTHFHAKRRIPRMNSEEPPRS